MVSVHNLLGTFFFVFFLSLCTLPTFSQSPFISPIRVPFLAHLPSGAKRQLQCLCGCQEQWYGRFVQLLDGLSLFFTSSSAKPPNESSCKHVQQFYSPVCPTLLWSQVDLWLRNCCKYMPPFPRLTYLLIIRLCKMYWKCFSTICLLKLPFSKQ